jgi:opacity protein-like surface antigen
MYIRAPIIAALFFATGMVSVQAADLAARPSVKAPAMVNSAYNWTGFYVGGHAGYSWMDSTVELSPANAAANSFFAPPAIIAPSVPVDPKGFMGGGQAGYNWQVDPMWVIGVETDLSWSNVKRTTSLPGPADPSRIVTVQEKLDWFGTFRGRVGVTPVDRVLVYATGGLWARRSINRADQSFRRGEYLRPSKQRWQQLSERIAIGDQDRMDGRRRDRMGIYRELEPQGRVPVLRPRKYLAYDG